MVHLSGGCPRIDERLGNLHRFGVGQRRVEPVEGIGLSTDGAPWHLRAESFEEREGAKKVSGFAAPTAADVQMLTVDCQMHVERARPSIGVMTGDEITPTVANQEWPLFEGPRRPGGLDDDVNALTVREVANVLETL